MIGQQALCLRPYVGYHPSLVQGQVSGSDEYARGHYGSEQDDAVSFYPQDFWVADSDGNVSRSSSPCDMFRRRLTVVHAPEPSLRLPYFDGFNGGLELVKWAESLASRTHKAHVLRQWMIEKGAGLDTPAEIEK